MTFVSTRTHCIVYITYEIYVVRVWVIYYVQCIIFMRDLRRVWLKLLAFRNRRTANDVKSTRFDRFLFFVLFAFSFIPSSFRDLPAPALYVPCSRPPDVYVNWERKINSRVHLYNRLKNRSDEIESVFAEITSACNTYAAVIVEPRDRIFAIRAIFHCDLYVLVRFVRYVTNSTGVWWPRNFKITIKYPTYNCFPDGIFIYTYCYTRCRPC